MAYEKILISFGEKIDDTYLLLQNEAWEDYNSYYSVAEFIDRYFGIEDSFSVICGSMREATCNVSVSEVEYELKIELPEESV